MPLNPLVSIALCTYNGERFLIKQLESILTQDYYNMEVIAVDDCSTDNTWAILQDYEQRDKRLKIFRNEKNLGYNRNFEQAIKLCTGEFIALTDQDDIWEKSKIATLLDAMQDNMMVYHDSDFMDDNDNRIGQAKMSSKHRMYEGESCLPLLLTNCISGHASLFSNKLMEYILPFKDAKYHDRWIAYVALNVGKVKFVDQVLVHYRQHQHSITDLLRLRKEDNDIKQIKHFDRLNVDLDWLKICSEYKYNREPDLVKKACTLFLDMAQGKNRFQCWLFIVKHFDLLFYITIERERKGLSKLNYIRKICYR